MTKRFVLVALLMLVGFAMTVAMAAPAPKVTICHIPPDDPDNFHSITVSENALAAHLAHGDLLGACNEVCAALCDDGDACTIDDDGDCEDGCPPIAPVDCNDGVACTDDSCNPDAGCVNTPVVCDPPDACTFSVCAVGDCVDTPKECPEGSTCNADTGNCDALPGDPCEGVECDPGTTCVPDADPLCAPAACDVDWVCETTANICGQGNNNFECLCDLNVEGDAFCWNNIFCSDPGVIACANSTDCQPGWQCFSNCCNGGAPTCLPPCGYLDGLTNSEESIGPTASGN